MPVPALKVRGEQTNCKLVTYVQYMSESCYEYDTDGEESTSGMTKHCYDQWKDLRANDYIDMYFGEGENRYFKISMKQGEYIDLFASNETGIVPPSVEYRIKFITFDPTNEWESRIEDNVTVTIISNGQLQSDLCDFSAVVSSEGISGDWYY